MSDVIDIRNIKLTENLTPAETAPKPQEKRTLQLSEIVDVATRLGRILAQESHFLSVMDFTSVAKLQEEKNKLISALEIQKKILKLDPGIKKGFTEEEIKEFQNVSAMFDTILHENHHQLMRVRAVNLRVVNFIAKAAAERNHSPTAYGKSGGVVPQRLSDLPLALSQNV